MSEQRRSILGSCLIVGIVCLVSMVVAPPLLARADDPPSRPPVATRKLPPREPTPTPKSVYPDRPVSVPVVPTSRSRPSVDGAAIELQVQFLADSPSSVEWREGLWTMVQWQDGLGEWHDVHGWRAKLDEVSGDEGKKLWYLSEDRFGKGPFSWVVYPAPDDEFIARSAPFYMPGNTGQTRRVKVSLGPLPVTAPTTTKSALPPTGGGQHLGLWKFLTISLVVLLAAQLLPRRDRWFG